MSIKIGIVFFDHVRNAPKKEFGYFMKARYDVKLKLNEEQRKLLFRYFDATRWVYNYALKRSIQHYQEKKEILPLSIIKREIQEMKKNFKDVSNSILMDSFIDISRKLAQFRRRAQKLPTFKKKTDNQIVHFFSNYKIRVKDKKIYIPKFKEGIWCDTPGWLLGKVFSLTIRTSKKGYIATIMIEEEIEKEKIIWNEVPDEFYKNLRR